MADNFGLKIGVEGEKEFKKALAEINQNYKFYSRNRRSNDYSIEELKSMIRHYFMSYWNNRRICCANYGLPPSLKRNRFYQKLNAVA